jgi:ATP-dependent Clp protease adaptor protein ClpS
MRAEHDHSMGADPDLSPLRRRAGLSSPQRLPILFPSPPERPAMTQVHLSQKRSDDIGTGRELGVVTSTKPKTKKPSMYKVLLFNDDYTPMEFVVYVLERFFNMSREEATRVMLHVHQKGVGVCGVFTYEVAETKVALVLDLARKNEHPLQCSMEKE